MTNEEFDLIVELYKQGNGYKKISNKTGINIKSVEARLLKWKRKNGLKEGVQAFAVNPTLKIKEPKVELTVKQKIEKPKKIFVAPDYAESVDEWTGDKIIRFGVVSDTHIGSKYQQITHLHSMYDIYEREGIKTVYNCGDITEGYKMRPGHEFECFFKGLDELKEIVIDKYPKRKDIITKFIIGNHDTRMIENSGFDIGLAVSRERKDMVYLGKLNAKVNITPNCSIELNHPLDGSSYALSYKLQKYIEQLEGGTKPNILFTGHYHKYFTMFYRNVHACCVPTFESQSSWMRGKGLAAHMGGLIITIHVKEDGTITRFIPEYVPNLDPIKNDY